MPYDPFVHTNLVQCQYCAQKVEMTETIAMFLDKVGIVYVCSYCQEKGE
jgi:DNA-directed RNA polymerase subunit RPC12/RpoP